MNPTEIQDDLPNGFHGAVIERIAVDYLAKNVTFFLRCLVPIDPQIEDRSRFRGANFQVLGLAFLSMDVPDERYDFNSGVAIEVGSLLDTDAKICPRFPMLKSELGEAYFFHTFFVEQWNAFIHFAGTEATFEWIED